MFKVLFFPRDRVKIYLSFGFVSLTWLLCLFQNDNVQIEMYSSDQKKTILVATEFYSNPFPRVIGVCPVECNYHFDDERDNLTLVANADAVLFHFTWQDMIPVMKLLRHRKRGQYSNTYYQFPNNNIWAFLTAESYDSTLISSRFTSYQAFDGLFNWSISFRRDSTLWTPYAGFIGFGSIHEKFKANSYRLQRFEPPDASKIATKRRHIAAVISNCHDTYGRLAVLEQLKSFGLTVDVYGACSPNNLKCPGRMSSECYEMLEEKYYFYASFENSLCKDYFTEKFLNVFNYDMVPVTINAAFIDQPDKNMPAFIDSKDFTSLKELANYLLEVVSNADRYHSYFEWRKNYGLLYDDSTTPLCLLCQAVQDDQIKKQTPLRNFTHWLSDQSGCHKELFPSL